MQLAYRSCQHGIRRNAPEQRHNGQERHRSEQVQRHNELELRVQLLHAQARRLGHTQELGSSMGIQRP